MIAKLGKFEQYTGYKVRASAEQAWIPVTLNCVCGASESLAMKMREEAYTCPNCRRFYLMRLDPNIRLEVGE